MNGIFCCGFVAVASTLRCGAGLPPKSNWHERKKWDRSSTVVDSLDNDQYQIMVDGVWTLTLRNRRFLRPSTPKTASMNQRAHLLELLKALASPATQAQFKMPRQNAGPPEQQQSVTLSVILDMLTPIILTKVLPPKLHHCWSYQSILSLIQFRLLRQRHLFK